MGQFTLGFLKHADVLGDAICLCVEGHHFCGEVNKFAWVEASTVIIEMVHELHGCDIGVERALMAKVAVPNFFDSIQDEFGCCTFGGFIEGIVPHEDCVFGLTTGPDNSSGIVGNDWVGQWAVGDGEGCSPHCGV